MSQLAKNVFVIGISGTTNSGKSTMVQLLKQSVPGSVSICQDYYFLPPGDPRLAPIAIPELDHHNWEDYRALEMDRMVDEVKQLITQLHNKSPQSVHVLFIDGFSIFGWRPLSSLFDLKYFLSVEKDVCATRRLTRDYDPPDKPGYFEKVVWPMHLKHLDLIKDQDDIVYLEGTVSVEEKCRRICAELDTLLQKHGLEKNS